MMHGETETNDFQLCAPQPKIIHCLYNKIAYVFQWISKLSSSKNFIESRSSKSKQPPVGEKKNTMTNSKQEIII
jgi:hypothetical protein